MWRTSILALAGLLISTLPQAALAQQPRPGELKSEFDFSHSLDTIQSLLEEAAEKCQIGDYKKAMVFLSNLRDEAEAVARKDGPGSESVGMVVGEIERSLRRAELELQILEVKCARQQQQQMKAGIDPTLPTKAELDKLWADAQKAFFAHGQAAANCNRTQMAIELEMLNYLLELATKYAAAVRDNVAKAPVAPVEANFVARNIATLRDTARGRAPLNCPGAKKEVPVLGPQTAPPLTPPKRSSQDCPIPGGVPGDMIAPGKAIPEHGMRFTPPDEQSTRFLAAHNQARAEFGVPDLIWDRGLAAGGATWAAQMSKVGRVHSPREGRECVRENLLQSLRGDRTPEEMIGVWVAEKVYFKPGTFPNVSTTGNWADVGHFTQIISATTTHVGCAVHSDARYDWTVCRYSPPGNIDGKPVGGIAGNRAPLIDADKARPTSTLTSEELAKTGQSNLAAIVNLAPPPQTPAQREAYLRERFVKANRACDIAAMRTILVDLHQLKDAAVIAGDKKLAERLESMVRQVGKALQRCERQAKEAQK